MKFIIDRTTWLRGEGNIDSYLLRSSDQKRCCLGHVLKQCGIEDYVLKDIASPSLIEEDSLVPEFIRKKTPYLNSDAAQDLISINDSIFTEDKEKEEKISKIFLKYGHEVEFIN